MPSQVQKERLTSKQAEEIVEEDIAQSTEAKAARDKLPEIDDLLDEIDGLLEENAEEFVKAYVQQGGE